MASSPEAFRKRFQSHGISNLKDIKIEESAKAVAEPVKAYQDVLDQTKAVSTTDYFSDLKDVFTGSDREFFKTDESAKAVAEPVKAYQDALDQTKVKGKDQIQAKDILLALKTKTLTIVKNPQFQTITICTAGGTVTLGAAGGAFGLAAGVATGSAVGLVPALFTFGLSIPASAVVGGSIGLCGGVATGSAAGAMSGGAAGYAVYKYRVEISDGVIYVKTRAKQSVEDTKFRINNMLALAEKKGKEFDKNIKELVKVMPQNIVTFTKKSVDKIVAAPRDPTFQVTAASTTAGAVAGGTVGMATGGTIGAAIGVVPALFTFGLSIPAGAVIGGGLGLCAGSSTGAVSGGAAGYYGYKYRSDIKKTALSLSDKAFLTVNQVKAKAVDSASQVGKSLGFSGTGGTV